MDRHCVSWPGSGWPGRPLVLTGGYPARAEHLGPGVLGPVQRGLAELAGEVVIVAVAEAEFDVVADVDFVLAGDAVDQAGLLERGLGGGPAWLCPQIGVGIALPLL